MPVCLRTLYNYIDEGGFIVYRTSLYYCDPMASWQKGCIEKNHDLWTCRAGEALSKAVEWCREHDLEVDAVNDNLPENAKA